jgi:hypothetical protein
MKLTLRLWHIVAGVAVICALYMTHLHLVRGKYQREVDMANTRLYQSDTKVKRYKVMVDSLEEDVAEKQVAIVSKQRMIRRLSQENERIKQLNVRNVKMIGELRVALHAAIDSIPPSDTIIIIKSKDHEGSFIKLPLDYKYSDRWVDMSAYIGMSGKADLNFSMNELPLNLVIGQKGYFRGKSDVVIASDPSPYLSVEDVKVMSVEDERRKPAHYIMVGTGFGLAISAAISFLF